jgi:hypothetical protein
MSISCHSCPTLMNLEFSQDIFEKYLNTKFHEDKFSGSRSVLFGLTDGRTDMSKLIVVFLNFANAPKNWALKCAK